MAALLAERQTDSLADTKQQTNIKLTISTKSENQHKTYETYKLSRKTYIQLNSRRRDREREDRSEIQSPEPRTQRPGVAIDMEMEMEMAMEMESHGHV